MGKAGSWPKIQRGAAVLTLFPQDLFKPFLFFRSLVPSVLIVI